MKLSEIRELIGILRSDAEMRTAIANADDIGDGDKEDRDSVSRMKYEAYYLVKSAAALEHLLQYVEWRPSSEAPEGDEPFLIRLDDGDRDHALNVAIARRLGQNWFFPTNQWPFEMASHFVPLPPQQAE